MAHFELVDGTEITSIALHPGKRVKGVRQWGGGADNKPLKLGSNNPAVADLADKSDAGFSSGTTQPFTLVSGATGVARISSTQQSGAAAGSSNYPALMVSVDEVVNHDGFDIDLLAEKLGRSEDAKRVVTYNRILDGQFDNGAMLNDFPYNQLGLKKDGTEKYPGVLGCGSEMESFGKSSMDGASLNFYAYHDPLPASGKVGDITFPGTRLAQAANTIAGLLAIGTPVRVALLYEDRFSKAGASCTPQHYVMIVGHKAKTRFLYIDPYPGFSKLNYKGGPKPGAATGFNSQFMGEFTLVTAGSKALLGGRCNYGIQTAIVFAGP